jgi:hypothetical protein
MRSYTKRLSTIVLAFSLLGASSAAYAAFIGVQNGWFPITATNSLGSSAAAYALGGAKRPLRLFYLGADGYLRITGQRADGSWDGTYNLGGPFVSAPAAAHWTANDQIVVARFGDQALWYRKFIPGTYSNVGQGWGPWTSLGGRFVSAPAVTGKGAGRYFVCGVGTDAHVSCGHLNANGFTGWTRFEGPTVSGKELTTLYSPAVTATSASHMELIMIGSNKRLYKKTWSDSWGAWTVWDDLGGQFAGSPAFAYWASDDVVAVGIGTDRQLWRKRFIDDNWEGTPWELIPGGTILAGSGLAAVSRANYQYDVFAEGTNYGLFWNVITE